MKKLLLLVSVLMLSCKTQDIINEITVETFTGLALPYPADATNEFNGFKFGSMSGEKSSFTWNHTDMDIDDKGFITRHDYTKLSSTTFETFILENEYLKLTILPGYGGRVLSMIYKPTDEEMLYQNPVGTPYLFGQNIFYYTEYFQHSQTQNTDVFGINRLITNLPRQIKMR